MVMAKGNTGSCGNGVGPSLVRTLQTMLVESNSLQTFVTVLLYAISIVIVISEMESGGLCDGMKTGTSNVATLTEKGFTTVKS
jgi:hypothetical protein